MLFRKPRKQSDPVPPELIEYARQFAQKLGVEPPQLLVDPKGDELEPPIYCPFAGRVLVFKQGLAEFDEAEAQWLLAHAVAISAYAPPRPLNGTILEQIALLPLVLTVVLFTVYGNLLLLIADVIVVTVVLVIYFKYASKRAQKRDEFAILTAWQQFDDHTSALRALKKDAARLCDTARRIVAELK